MSSLTEPRMTYTSCIRIVEKSYGKTCQISRIQCYVLVITEKYDLSFQLAYHTLAFDFQTTSAEGQALLDMSKIQQAVVLDLRTSNILVSVLPTIDQLISKTFHLEGNQRILKTNRYTENTKIPFIRRKIEISECSSPVTAVTHPAHPSS